MKFSNSMFLLIYFKFEFFIAFGDLILSDLLNLRIGYKVGALMISSQGLYIEVYLSTLGALH